MILDVLLPHWPEGIKADVQGDESELDPLGPKRVHQLGSEVQSRRGRSHGARHAGVDGLVALGVVQWLVDVGGKGDLPHLLQPGLNRLLELNEPSAGGGDGYRSSMQLSPFLANGQRSAHSHPPPADQRLPDALPPFGQQQELHLASGGHLTGQEPGGDDPAFVGHQKIPWL